MKLEKAALGAATACADERALAAVTDPHGFVVPRREWGVISYRPRLPDLIKPTIEERTQALIGIRIGGKYWLYENQGGKSALTVSNKTSLHCRSDTKRLTDP